MAGSSKSSAPKRPFREQKKQARLQFSALPSSSPAKENYDSAVQDRLAGVTYEGAKELRRTADKASPEPSSLLSPESSSELQGQSEAEMLPRTSFPSSPTRDRVSRIQLLDDSDEDDLISPAQKRRKISDVLPATPTPASLPRRQSRRLHPGSSSPLRKQALSLSDSEPEDLQSSPPTRRSGRLRGRMSPQTAPSTRSDSLSTPASVEVKSPSHVHSASSALGSPETSDDDNVIMFTKPTPRRTSRFEADDPFIVNNDELQYASNDEMHQRQTPKRKISRGDEFVVNDDDVEFISSENEDNAPNVRPTTKSRRMSSKAKPSRIAGSRTREEQAEIDEDLQDLQDFVPEPDESRTRTRGGPVTTQRDKTREHLELLKRRRAGEKVPRNGDSDEQMEEDQRGVDIDFIGQPDYATSGAEASSSDTDQEAENGDIDQEEDEDDFVEDDTAGRLGRPHPDIPLQFTSFASKKPKELFIHIIEWMVKNKVAPAFNRDDPVLNLAFGRVDDQVKAQAGSRLISSAWGANFKNAILARPMMKVVALPGEDEDHMRTCDACNRSNNPARYEFTLSGEPYYKKTLEPVENSDEDDEDEEAADNNSITYDEAGHIIPSQETRFYLGRFCAANAEMGHKLTHWKYHLNDSLMSYLESQGVLSSESIIAREKMNKKRREKEAENIVDSMEETGVIDDFWRAFENDLNDARLGMEDYEKKGGRSKGRVGAIRAKSGGLVKEWDKDKFRISKALESDSEGE